MSLNEQDAVLIVAIAKMTARCTLYGCSENFRQFLTTLTATIPEIFNVNVPIDPMNVRVKFEVRSFTLRVPEIIVGYFKTMCSPWICPRYLFSKIFNGP